MLFEVCAITEVVYAMYVAFAMLSFITVVQLKPQYYPSRKMFLLASLVPIMGWAFWYRDIHRRCIRKYDI